MLRNDVHFLRNRYNLDQKGKAEGRLVLRFVHSVATRSQINNLSQRNESASSVYTTDVITKILKEEGASLFDSRSASLGHTLQGGVPSPLDRARAVRLSLKAMEFIEKYAEQINKLPSTKRKAPRESAAVLTSQGSQIVATPVQDMVQHADMTNRRGIKTWWEGFQALAERMGGRSELAEES